MESEEVIIPISTDVDIDDKTESEREVISERELTENEEQLREQLVRMAAELDNLQKRTFKRIELARLDDRRGMLRAFIEVVDSLDRALQNGGVEPNSWRQGMEVIHRQILSVIKSFGASPMDALGELFDPNFHEAVAVVAAPDQAEGVVIKVLQVGYIMGDGSLLRPAKVVVAGAESGR